MDQALGTPAKNDEQSLGQALSIHTYTRGDEIIHEGRYTPHFYVVLSGQVRITKKAQKILLLEDQDIFGLDQIVLKKPSLFTATAASDCRIAVYGPEALDYFIRNNPRTTQSLLSSILKQLGQAIQNLLQGSEPFALEEVDVRFYQDGDVIIEEGTKGTDFYRLVSTQGGLKVSIKGKELEPIKTPGEFFGEIAGLLNLPRQATITSIGDSVIERYSADNLDILIRDYPDVALQMMRTLISRLLEVDARLVGRKEE